MNPPTRTYSKDGTHVDWRPELCTHCQECTNGLPSVFDLTKRPWVNMDGATMREIRLQVQKCPSGALSQRNELETLD